MNIIQRFERNRVGRDFVVGDIHGCFDLLSRAMDTVGFDESCDRLFSVGDLVDRGPSSHEAIDWIAQPWFHAVRGNHEQMAIGVAQGRHDHDNYLRNGGGWFLSLGDDRQKLVAAVFDTLPIAIEIDHAVGRIGLVHADIWGESWDGFLRDMQSDLSNSKRHKLVEVALWSRSRIQAHQSGYPTSSVSDLHAMFVGHTPVEKPLCLGNVVYIDTGAVFGRSLTLINIADCVSAQAEAA
ncbi:metallophosphoesterase [Dyella japonica]|uniref:Serine/threonine protein phosphatase 1 n=1 Tax=Dyella japonica TaxID=231455 RepID=A0ABV2K1U8_9GAMM